MVQFERSEGMADQLHHTMNNLQPKLTFKIEKLEITPNGLSLSLLDFKVTVSKDGKSSFEFYKKKDSKETTIQSPSISNTRPRKSRINFISNELKHIQDKRSTKTTTTKHLNMFEDILRLHGYSDISIEQTKHPQSYPKDNRPFKTEWSYLKIPYISELLDYRITSIFSEKRKYQYLSRTSHTPSDKLSPTTPRNGYARGTTALPPTPNCAY